MKTRLTLISGSISIILAAVAWSAQPAFSQEQPAIGSPIGRNTPQPVLDSSASVVGHYAANQMLRLSIGLQPANVAAQEQFIQDLQDRNSPQFHRFLTPDEWAARFAPSIQDEQAVVNWAQSQGLTVTARYPNRLVVDVAAPSSVIEAAMGLKINTYQLGSRTFYSNDRDPALPYTLAKSIVSIEGLNNLQVMHPANQTLAEPAFADYQPGPAVGQPFEGHANAVSSKLPGAQDGPSPNKTSGAYDPTDMYSSNAYDTTALNNQGHCCNPLHNAGGTPRESSIAIATAGGQNPSDFQGFHNQYPYLAWHYVMIPVDGATVPCSSGCDGEGTMDFEWATAMSNSFGSYLDTSTVYMYDGVDAKFSTFIDVYNRILSDNNARIFSSSWGCAEAPTCYSTSTMATIHNIFNAFVSQGWTLIVASGDQGATAGCASRLGVQYPASDPDILGAGGTTLNLNSNGTFASHSAWSGGPDGCGSNDGGSTGGVSSYFSNRTVPDLALNADWYYRPQNIYFGGRLQGNGGTSIVAPELAGFFAQANAYLLYVGSLVGSSTCYGSATAPCLLSGNAPAIVNYIGNNKAFAPHYPFYDITSGCNDNDVTLAHNLGYYCAGAGHDDVTGWGSFNMLQLSWAINTYIAGDGGAPLIKFTGPITSKWYNTNQAVSWTISDTAVYSGHQPNGVAGYARSWDAAIGDVTKEATPGQGNPFYSGPEFPNANSGSLSLSGLAEGCHYAHVEAWDNGGLPSGDLSYGPVCYDVSAPKTTAVLAGTQSGSTYTSAVKVSLSAADSYSGVSKTYYQVNGGATTLYSAPFTVSSTGTYTVVFWSIDNAGNQESNQSVTFTIHIGSLNGVPLQFVAMTPCRIADTRTAAGTFGGPIMAAGSIRKFPVPSSTCNVPAGAAAYSLNVTVVPSEPLGYLTIWPSDQSKPLVSTLNSDGRVKANAAIVSAANSDGGVDVYVTNATHVIIDIDGYFVPTTALQYYPVTPCRVADTRHANGPLGGPFLSAESSRALPVLSSTCGIPSSAQAYSLNFTAIPRGPFGFLTTWPTGQAKPLVSTLNAPTGAVTANAAIVPAGSLGDITVFVSDATDLAVDVNGYFAPPTAAGLSLYTLASPCRVLDTRLPAGTLPFSGTIAAAVSTSGCGATLSSAQAFTLNATVVPTGSLGWITLWQDGVTRPAASTLNAYDGAITSNMALVPTTSGSVNAFASNPTYLILDISSYFAH